jgi:putative ABC transport system permease protein
MEIFSIIAALQRKSVGALLISLQIAVTLAIVCNSLSIIHQRLERTKRPSGVDESNVFSFRNQWVGQPKDLAARIRADLVALRSLPGVIDAVATDSFPLNGTGPYAGIALSSTQRRPETTAAYYMVDEHGAKAFGARLVAGRWFTAGEIHDFLSADTYSPSVVIITSALAASLFPAGNPLGQKVYLLSSAPAPVIGIVARFQTPLAATSQGEAFVENSAFLPAQVVYNQLYYVVRTRSGQRDAVMRTAPNKLFQLSAARVVDKMATFQETRDRAYRGDHALSLVLGTVSALLVIVTGFGVVGLTSYWVAQQRRQIGIRRALGARRIDILQYFHLENLLVAGAGAALGVGIGIAGNLWLATSLQLTRMTMGFICLGAVLVLVLSQGAVLWPAFRATRVPPAIAARGE